MGSLRVGEVEKSFEERVRRGGVRERGLIVARKMSRGVFIVDDDAT